MTTMFTASTRAKRNNTNPYVTNTAAAISDDHDDSGAKIVYHVRVVGAGLAGLTTTTTTAATNLTAMSTTTTTSDELWASLAPHAVVAVQAPEPGLTDELAKPKAD